MLLQLHAAVTRRRNLLRSSPAPKGRCCPARRRGRCRRTRRGCDPHRPRRADAAARLGHRVREDVAVAILTGPEGPMLLRRRCSKPGPIWSCCDPHRPRRADAAAPAAATQPLPTCSVLRSSPAPKGRCCPSRVVSAEPVNDCCDPHRPRRADAAANPTWRWFLWPESVLRSSPAPKGRCCLQPGVLQPRLHVLGCDPHRPRRADAAWGVPPTQGGPNKGVAILTGPEGPMLLPVEVPVLDPDMVLRSSPAPKGRCCGS